MRHIPHHNTRIRVHQFGSLLRIHLPRRVSRWKSALKGAENRRLQSAPCDVVDGPERVSPQGGPYRGQVISRDADRNVRNQIRDLDDQAECRRVPEW